MSELDFSREAVPHVRGQRKPVAIFESDDFCRTQLLPKLFQLDENQRSLFEIQFLAHFAPDIDEPSRFAAQVVFRKLDIEQLHETAHVLQTFLDKQ